MSFAHGLRPEFRFPNGLYYSATVDATRLQRKRTTEKHLEKEIWRGKCEPRASGLAGGR